MSIAKYENLIQIGVVESVDIEQATARVRFIDKQNMLSDALKIVSTPPMIVVEKEVDGEKWDMTAAYQTVERNTSTGMLFKKESPDVISLSKTIQYEKSADAAIQDQCAYTGVIDEKTHKVTIKVHSWMPYLGQSVLCLFPANLKGKGYITGGV